MSEITSVAAHYDGKSFVPDEPVDVTKGEAVVLDIHKKVNTEAQAEQATVASGLKFKTAEERKAALQRVIDAMQGLPEVPMEALRRENMYADDTY